MRIVTSWIASAAVVGLACLQLAPAVEAQVGAQATRSRKTDAADLGLSYQRHVESVGPAVADVDLAAKKAWVAALGGHGPSIAVAGLKLPPRQFNVPMPRARLRATMNVSHAIGTKCLARLAVQKSGTETGPLSGLPTTALSRPGPVTLVSEVLPLTFNVTYQARAEVGCVVLAPDGAIHAAAATITELKWEPQ
jgi:hypothetical protein